MSLSNKITVISSIPTEPANIQTVRNQDPEQLPLLLLSFATMPHRKTVRVGIMVLRCGWNKKIYFHICIAQRNAT